VRATSDVRGDIDTMLDACWKELESRLGSTAGVYRRRETFNCASRLFEKPNKACVGCLIVV